MLESKDVLDEKFMIEALKEAEAAEREGNIPVGAVIVYDGQVIAKGQNCRRIENDPTGHAEIVAIRKAADRLGRWNLSGCSLYVTLEPCPMCAGAIMLSRIARVVYGCTDPKAGACGSLYNIICDTRLNHRCEIRTGVLGDRCATILQDFFRKCRKKR